MGPSPIQSVCRFRYYIHFIDEFSRYTWLYPLKNKEDTIIAFKHFQNMVETQFQTKIKSIQCDNGTEYKLLIHITNNSGIIIVKGFKSSEKGLRSYISLQFYLLQRKQDISGDSTEFVMKSIADFLQIKLNSRSFNGKFDQFIVNTSNNDSNLILINYLNTFPLLSSKYLDYKD